MKFLEISEVHQTTLFVKYQSQKSYFCSKDIGYKNVYEWLMLEMCF